ncbi:hypothetical protein [Streptomyces sp. NPDC001404]|uniref:hypothetical protein n=1 Tax=Streptomyces sp. NPDC001404 TaxID=3364571 RepID=UPI00369BEA52
MPHLDQRRAELLRRRLTGEDFTTIASELNYPDAAAAAADFTQALTDAEPLEPAVRHEADQQSLDELQHAIWDAATAGDLDAIATTLAIFDSRSRLTDLAAPARREAAAGPIDSAAVTNAELDELLALIEDPPI